MNFIYKLLVSAVLFLAATLSLNAQEGPCASDLIVGPKPIKVSGTWTGGDQTVTYRVNVELKSATGGSFKLVPNHLNDELSDDIINGAGISTAPSLIILDPNVNKLVELTITGVIPASGKYSGDLVFKNEQTGCQTKAPIAVYSTLANQVVVIDKDQSINLKVVDPSIISSWLPKRIAQQGISVTLDNKGNFPITVKDYSLWLKGDITNDELDESFFSLSKDADRVIPPQSYKTLRFDLNRKAHVSADTYTGNLRLIFDENVAATSVSLTMSARSNAFWAIVALLLGILVGYLTRSIDNPLMKEKMSLMNKLTQIKAEAGYLEEPYTQGACRKMISEMDGKIEGMKTVEESDSLDAEMDVMAGKIVTLRRLEKVSLQISEGMTDAQWEMAEPKVDAVRDNILAGNEAAAQEGFIALKDLAVGQRSRSLDSATAEVYDAGLSDLEAELSKQAAKQQALKEPSQASTAWNWLKKGFIRVVGFALGASINAKVAYWFIRPLAVLVVFIFILWLGFWDLYVEGGDTFGADGVYDYMKLFLWGAVSNILSQTMMGGGSFGAIQQSMTGGSAPPPAV